MEVANEDYKRAMQQNLAIAMLVNMVKGGMVHKAVAENPASLLTLLG